MNQNKKTMRFSPVYHVLPSQCRNLVALNNFGVVPGVVHGVVPGVVHRVVHSVVPGVVNYGASEGIISIDKIE